MLFSSAFGAHCNWRVPLVGSSSLFLFVFCCSCSILFSLVFCFLLFSFSSNKSLYVGMASSKIALLQDDDPTYGSDLMKTCKRDLLSLCFHYELTPETVANIVTEGYVSLLSIRVITDPTRIEEYCQCACNKAQFNLLSAMLKHIQSGVTFDDGSKKGKRTAAAADLPGPSKANLPVSGKKLCSASKSKAKQLPDDSKKVDDDSDDMDDADTEETDDVEKVESLGDDEVS